MKPGNILAQRNAPLSVGVEPAQELAGLEPTFKEMQKRTPVPFKSVRERVEVVESYFGADGRPVKRKKTGAARVARQYDERGNKVEEAYYNELGKPMLRKDIGAARIAWTYDASGKRSEAVLFGADGTLIETRDGAPAPEDA